MGIKISQLATELTELDDGDLLAAVDVDGNLTGKITKQNLRDTLIEGAASTISEGDLAASRALVSNVSGKVEASAVTAAELAYLSGVTSALQSQIDSIGTAPRNLLANSNFTFWDLGTSPTATDGVYFVPRWRYVTDATASREASQQTSSPPTGSRYYARLKGEATATVHVGSFFVLRGNDSIPLQDQVVSLSFQAKGAGTLYAGVLAWTGTIDSSGVLGIDPVSSWAATPTMVAGYTFENTPASLGALTGSFQPFSIENINLDTAGVNNVAVFIWVRASAPGTATATLDLVQMQLERGATVTQYIALPERAERDLIALANYAATGAPGSGDDVADGYARGSPWIDVSAGDHYVCLNPTAGGVVWKKTTP